MPHKLILEEVAALARCCTKSIRRLVADGECPRPIRLGRRLLFDADAIERWLRTGRVDDATAKAG